MIVEEFFEEDNIEENNESVTKSVPSRQKKASNKSGKNKFINIIVKT